MPGDGAHTVCGVVVVVQVRRRAAARVPPRRPCRGVRIFFLRWISLSCSRSATICMSGRTRGLGELVLRRGNATPLSFLAFI